MRTIAIIFFLFFKLSSFAQLISDTIYPRYIVKQLSSPIFFGRGYLNNGINKAADFIAAEYGKIGLLPIRENYFQNFSYSVNTFPMSPEIWMDECKLVPGTDFLVSPDAAKFKGRFNVAFLDTIRNENEFDAEIKNNTGKIVVIHSKQLLYPSLEEAKIAGLVIRTPKLTHSVSSNQVQKSLFRATIREDLNIEGRSVQIKIKPKFIQSYKVKNVIGYVKGYSNSDTCIILSAHYDHLGGMGKKTFFPGANDNASGVSMMLLLAKAIAANPIKYNVVFIAFAGEEIGLKGSKYYVEHPLIELSKTKLVLNLDMVGGAKEAITIVNGKKYHTISALFSKYNEILGSGFNIKLRDVACNSDHCPFEQSGCVSVFIYGTDSGFMHYHDVYDKAEKLPFSKFFELTGLIHEVLKEIN